MSHKTPAGMPPSRTLAKVTDHDGYTIEVIGGVPAMERIGTMRKGRYRIISPSGHAVRSGYWMGQHYDLPGVTAEQWAKMSWEERAALEAQQQASAYKPLREQFAERARERPVADISQLNPHAGAVLVRAHVRDGHTVHAYQRRK